VKWPGVDAWAQPDSGGDMGENSIVRLEFGGLVTEGGSLIRGGGATFTIATNVLFESPGVIRIRRGMGRGARTLANSVGRTNGEVYPPLCIATDKKLELLFSSTSGAIGSGEKPAFITVDDGSLNTTGTYLPFSAYGGIMFNGQVYAIDPANASAFADQSAVSRANCYLSIARASSNSERRTKFTSNDTHFYWTGGAAIVRWDGSKSGTSMNGNSFAGMPSGLGLDTVTPAAVLTAVAGGFLPSSGSVSYRVTFCRKQNGKVIEGAPLGRTVIRNVTGTSGWVAATPANVNARIILPAGFDISASEGPVFYRLYRTKSVASGVPGDEHFLVYEDFITNTNITNGYVDITDSTPDSFVSLADVTLGTQPLHTNPNSATVEAGGIKGIDNANLTPPIGTDITHFKQRMFISEIYNRPEQSITLLSVGAPGLAIADALTFTYTHAAGSYNFTCTAVAAAPTNQQFILYTASADPIENIERTAQNLVKCINRHPNNTQTGVTAFYVSAQSGFPGRILIKTNPYSLGQGGAEYAYHFGREFSDNTAPIPTLRISLNNARTAAFVPVVPQTASYLEAKGSAEQNGIAWSKVGQSDAFPSTNRLRIGGGSNVVLRIIPFRDSLFIFTSDGLYRLTGNEPPWNVDVFDSSIKLVSREAVGVSDDAIYCWSVNGLMEITDQGAREISVPIRSFISDIYRNITSAGRLFYDHRFFTVVEAVENKVYFYYPTGTPTTGTDLGCSKWLVYDTSSKKWSSGEVASNMARYHGAARQLDGRQVVVQGKLGNGANTSSYLAYTYDTGTNTDYTEQDWSGASAPYYGTIVCNYEAPDPTQLMHWQYVQVMWEHYEPNNAITQFPPAYARIDYFAEYNRRASTSGSPETAINYNAAGQWTVLVPVSKDIRRSSGLAFKMIVGTDFYWGIEGIGLIYRPGSRRTANK